MNVKAEMDALFMVISNSIMEGKPDVFLQAGWNSLRTNVSSLESRIAELAQAVGLITTLKPTMVMDADHPLDMAKEVAEYVTARIAELEAERRWIPVGERLPELDQEVLIYDQRGDITIDYLVALNREGTPYYTNSDDGALFWMPLPTLPEATHDR